MQRACLKNDRGRWLALAAEAVVVAGAALFLLHILHPALLVKDTIPAGGDVTSHVGTLHKLIDLLKEGRVTGWHQGNFAGFPLLQFYFPFPFLVMAFLSLILPVNVAFKIGMVLPVLLLPGAIALGLRRMRFTAPVPALGALFSLLVLLNERQSVWGGNLMSLLAGEICYAYGYLFFVLFLAELWRSVDAGRVSVAAIALEVAMGLSHGYALLFAGIVSFFLLFAGSSPLRALRVIVVTHVTAFFVLGVWIVPLLRYLPVSTAFNHIWVLDRADDLLPPHLAPIGILALIGLVGALVMRLRGARMDGRLLLWAGTAVSALLIYRVGYRLHVVDIRFLPFWLMGLTLAAAAGLEKIAAVPRSAWALPLAAASCLGLLLPGSYDATSGWARGNFAGLESRAGWKKLSEITRVLEGGLGDPRIFYEHSGDHEPLGTVRIFESLPWLAGRQTLEGIYIQSSLCAPPVYYIQSELSEVTSAALPDYHYAHPAIETGIRHLDQFRARQLIIRSESMKRRLDAFPGVRRETDIGPYRIYARVGNDSGWAVPIRSVPLVYEGSSAKAFAYRHFLAHPTGDPVVVLPYGGDKPPAEWARVRDGETMTAVPWRAGESVPVVACEMDGEEVRIQTDRPGWPILLSMNYHPRWRAEGGTILAATPGFVLVIPTRNQVVLRYENTVVEQAGWTLTLVGIGLCGWFLWRRRAREGAGLAVGEPSYGDPTRHRWMNRSLDVIFVATLSCLACLPYASSQRAVAEWQWHGEEAHSRGDRAEALRCFDEVVRIGGQDPVRRSYLVKGLRWRSIVLDTMGDQVGSAAAMSRIVREFPESEWAPQMILRLAPVEYAAKRDTEAAALLRRIMIDDPAGPDALQASGILNSYSP